MTSNELSSKSKWTQREIDYLKLNWGNLKPCELAATLNRTEASINKKASRLGFAVKLVDWSKEEVDYLTEHWETLPRSVLAKSLNRTERAVVTKAQKIGLKFPESNHWSKKDIEYLKEAFGNLSCSVLASSLCRSEESVKKKAQQLRLEPKHARFWNQEDTEYLIEHWGKSEFHTLKKRLKRSSGAIKRKAGELNLGSAVSAMGEFLTLHYISQSIGVKRDTILNWGESYGLPIELHNLNKRPTSMVRTDDLMVWLESNQDKWSAYKMEPLSFVPEPQWLKAKIRRDKTMVHTKERRSWSPLEDARLKFFYLQGLTHKEISSKLENRTPAAVTKRLAKINVWDTSTKKHQTK